MGIGALTKIGVVTLAMIITAHTELYNINKRS
jgi:hypothetical protein